MVLDRFARRIRSEVWLSIQPCFPLGFLASRIAFREIDLEQRNVPMEVAEAMREARKPRGKS
jgi:hypothetical protein